MAPEIKYTKIFINNLWEDAKSGKTFNTVNPHDETVIAKVAEGDKADVDVAVSAAKKAFHRNSEWPQLNPSDRSKLLHKWIDLIERDFDYLSQLETYDNGAVCSNAQMFLNMAIGSARYLATLADKVEGATLPLDGQVFSYTLKQPIGVCALILPWNGPIVLFIAKVVAALAAGCTVIVKPAEQTPLTALAVAALSKEAGFPAGVLNVVPGYGATAGAALASHPDVAKISFTGSVAVGKLIQQASGASNLKRVTLELGGKSPLIIMDDANLDIAVSYAALGVFANQGQICIAASRLFVHSSIYDEFVARAVQYAKTLTIGNPADPKTLTRMLVAVDHHSWRSLKEPYIRQWAEKIDERMFKKVLGYIEKGKQEGARLLTGGKRFGNSGYYIEPTVFVDVKDHMTIAKEEIFGPVQSILKFDTIDEVLDRANNTNFGLAAGIFTTSLDTALQFSKHLESGIVWVNTYLHMAPQAPFGGVKESGIGREYGSKALDAYLEEKCVVISMSKKFGA